MADLITQADLEQRIGPRTLAQFCDDDGDKKDKEKEQLDEDEGKEKKEEMSAKSGAKLAAQKLAVGGEVPGSAT